MKTKTALLAIVSVLMLTSCSSRPLAWHPPKQSDNIKTNELLQKTEWIDLKGYYGPEDIAIDSVGNIYAGVRPKKDDFSDGKIIKIDKDGEISTYADTHSWVCGLHFDKEENLIGCDTQRGLISVDKRGKIITLASQDDRGRKILIPNDVDIAEDGVIYFSNTSSTMKFNPDNARKILAEQRADGALYSYNPNTKEIKTLIDGTYFGNGVAVSQDGSFVLLVDLARYQVRRHWLKGEKAGSTDIFIDNLPGLPNGISRRKDGSFWLGFTTERVAILDTIHPYPWLKQLVLALPRWMQPPQKPYGIVMHLSQEGEILQSYYDTSGKFVSEASSIEEYEGELYLGGDLIDHIGRFRF